MSEVKETSDKIDIDIPQLRGKSKEEKIQWLEKNGNRIDNYLASLKQHTPNSGSYQDKPFTDYRYRKAEPPKKKKRLTSFYIDPDVHSEICHLSIELSVSMTRLINEGIQVVLARHKKPTS